LPYAQPSYAVKPRSSREDVSDCRWVVYKAFDYSDEQSSTPFKKVSYFSWCGCYCQSELSERLKKAWAFYGSMVRENLEERIGKQPRLENLKQVSIRGKGKNSKATLIFDDLRPSTLSVAMDVAEAINALGIDNVHADVYKGDNENEYCVMDLDGPSTRTTTWYDIQRAGSKITISPTEGRIGTYNQSDFLHAYVRRVRESLRS